MEIVLDAVNTAVLICSSFSTALSVYFAELGKPKCVILFLLVTMIIGAVFSLHEIHGILSALPGPTKCPVSGSSITRPVHPSSRGFCLCFIMTGLYAFHMMIGIGILFVLLFRTLLGSSSAD